MTKKARAVKARTKKPKIRRDDATIRALGEAESRLSSGNLQGCKSVCDAILRRTPHEPEALFMLGFIAAQERDFETTIDLLQRSIELDPSEAHYFNVLGVACKELGHFDEAKRHFQNAIRLAPSDDSIHNNLGCVHKEQGNFKEARLCFENALRLAPSDLDASNNLGVVLMALEQSRLAIPHFQKVLKTRPDDPVVWRNLAISVMRDGRFEESERCFRNSLQLDPNSAQTYYYYGLLLSRQRRLTEAVDQFETALRLKTTEDTLLQLGVNLTMMGALERAIETYHQLLAMTATPSPTIISSYLFLFNYIVDQNSEDIYKAHSHWGLELSKAIEQLKPVTLSDTDSAIRIGYVSGDFKNHSVAFFIEPILAQHTERVEVYCYSNVENPDGVTDRIRARVAHWRDASHMSDESLASQIRKDGIQILVDLSGHTEANRLATFAAKPSPIQATYLGYPNTTGIPEIDYRITDAIADPAGETDQYHTEQLQRLPECFLCYLAPDHFPEITNAPVTRGQGVTFGSFNNLSKAGDDVKQLWARILSELPDSRLLLKAAQLSDPRLQESLLAFFERFGIDRSRILLRQQLIDPKKHLDIYNEVDVALDTYPYNGTTTTFEALWMGVPVITLCGKVHAARVGASILKNLQHGELVAENDDEYCAIATRLAKDFEAIKQYKSNLRAEMEASVLTDAKSFTSKLEDMYEGWVARANDGKGAR